VVVVEEVVVVVDVAAAVGPVADDVDCYYLLELVVYVLRLPIQILLIIIYNQYDN
jgi:hypothetical protein